jgi:DNA polymerase I
LSAFRSRTSRNQPSSSKFIFGPSVWIRGLITPPPGHALVYIDWCQQEFGIAGALSGDHVMQDAYASGEPYMAFARQAGAIPQDGTKATHGHVRELYKICALAVQYGMTEWGLSQRIGGPPIITANLLREHHQVFRRFWQWSDSVVDSAILTGKLATVFGWTLRVTAEDFNALSLRNFPMQANGAEMLRLACCLATERGVEVCAPVHDALLICARFDRLDDAIITTRAAMAEASRIVLNGFELRTDFKVTPWPRRYMDPRGERMWETVNEIIDAAERGAGALYEWQRAIF